VCAGCVANASLLNKITAVDYEETNVEWQIETNKASDSHHHSLLVTAST